MCDSRLPIFKDPFGAVAAGTSVRFSICLPASQELTLNPALLTAALEETFGVPAAEASILRTHFLTAEKALFA